jgi:saccharopine dehydrogenase-like NADP-dependent oxidoreductase
VRGGGELLDDVDVVRIRLFEDTESDEPVSTWSADVCFDEAVAAPILYRRGRFRRGRRFGELEVFEFPAPIGRRRCVLAAQDEVATLPRYLPIRELDVKIGGREVEQARDWHRQRRLRAGRPPHRSRFPPTPSPAELAVLMRRGVLHEARFAIAVLVHGTRKNEPVTLRYDVSFPSLQQLAARELFTTPIAYATAVLAASFAAQLPARHPGVFPPEVLPPAGRRAVLSGLRKRGIVIRRTIVPAD